MGFQRRHIYSVSILILIGHTVAAQDSGPNNSKRAVDLLDKAYLAATQYPPLAYDAENKSDEMRLSVKYYQRGNELDILKIRYDMIDGEEKAVIKSRAVGDGSRLIHYDTASIEGPLERGKLAAYFTSDKTRLAILLARRSMCAHLDGWAGFDNEHLSESMKNADTLVLLDEMEDVADSACHVLESFGPRGHHKVWIDPKHGYHVRKAIIEKQADDLYGTRTVAGVKQSSFKTVIEIIKFQNIDGIWFPVEGTEDRTWGSLNEDGTESFRNVRSTARRFNIRFNLNFEELGAFVIDIPDGTALRNLEDRKTSYIWWNNRPEKVSQVHGSMVGLHAAPIKYEKCYNNPAGDVDYSNKITVLDFFGVWCGPCMAKIPFLKHLHEQYSDRGLVIIGVHTPRAKEKIPEFIAREKIKYQIVVDYLGKTAKQFNVFYHPTVVLIDRKGIIRAVDPSDEELEDLLESYF